jgi:hypothetical protein
MHGQSYPLVPLKVVYEIIGFLLAGFLTKAKPASTEYRLTAASVLPQL